VRAQETQEKGDIALGNPCSTTARGWRTTNAPLREITSDSNDAVLWHPGKLWSLWDMLLNHFPIYEITVDLQKLRVIADRYLASRIGNGPINDLESRQFRELLEKIQQEFPPLGLTQTSEIAQSITGRPTPETYRELSIELAHLGDSLGRELKREGIFRIPPERKDYFERDDLFGPEVAAAFPSCERDIRKAGSCYALGHEDACVHHLMLVLERGLKALAAEVGVVPFHHSGWQDVINRIKKQLDSSLPRGPKRDFYLHVNAQFGFLKEAYRNHSEHAHDDPYDMAKALSILNHVNDFMRELEKGGLKS
jgi:hypothetical protein